MTPADSMATSVPAPMAMADVGTRERRGVVVDAVADHGDPKATCLELGDLGVLVLGQHLGHDLVDSHVPADRLRDLVSVSGDRHDLHGRVGTPP